MISIFQFLTNYIQERQDPYLSAATRFKASHGWYEKFLKMIFFSLRKRTSLSQKRPQQLQSKIKTLCIQCTEAIKVDKYPLSLIGYISETPMSFNILPERSVGKEGTKSVVIRTSGLATVDGSILSPKIIFKGKMNRVIRDLVLQKEFLATTQEKAWMHKGKKGNDHVAMANMD